MSDNLKIRLTGGLLTLCGLALGWWLIFEPYRQATVGMSRIDISLKGLFFAPLIIVFGLACLVFGKALPLRGADPATQRRGGLILFAVIAAIGTLIFFWLKSQFSALGYDWV